MAAVSFVGALKDKYCPQEGPPNPLKSCSITESAIYMAPGGFTIIINLHIINLHKLFLRCWLSTGEKA